MERDLSGAGVADRSAFTSALHWQVEEITAPGHDGSLGRNEGMILREVVLLTRSLCLGRTDAEAEPYRRFAREVGCVGDLYRRVLPKVLTAETAKVVVDVADLDLPTAAPWVDPAHISRMLSVTMTPWTLPFSRYWDADEKGRRQLALETLHQGLVWLARIEDWDPSPFEDAYEECLARGLNNEFTHPQAYPNPARNTTIRLFCQFGMQEARIYADIKQGRHDRGRYYLGAAIPEAYTVVVVLRSLQWIDDVRFCLQLGPGQRGGTQEFSVSELMVGTSGTETR